jgi:nitrogen fixation NifU-like protein
MLKGEGDEIPEEFEDLDALKGVRQFPVRVKCALLSWLALIEGIENFKKGKTDDKTIVSTEEDS